MTIVVLSCLLLLQCKKEDNPVNIQDEMFRRALIHLGIDKDNNGIITQSEAEAASSLELTEWNISDLTGIDQFRNLDTLYCDYNNLSDIDLTKNIKLKFLCCCHNKLTSIDLTSNTSLTYLACGKNLLTSIDLSRNEALKELDCSENYLKELDISQNNGLVIIICTSNALLSLDVSKATQLRSLRCGNYDQSAHRNKLISLDIRNNINLSYLEAVNMPSLGRICVRQIPPPGLYISSTNLSNYYNLCN